MSGLCWEWVDMSGLCWEWEGMSDCNEDSGSTGSGTAVIRTLLRISTRSVVIHLCRLGNWGNILSDNVGLLRLVTV